MTELYIAGTLFGVLFVFVLAMWINSRRKRHSKIIRTRQPAEWHRDDAKSPIERIASSPVAWTLAFFGVVAALLGATLVIISGAVEFGDSPWGIIVPLFGVLFAGFIVYNVYAIARNRGHSNALSIAQSLVILGLFAIIGVAGLLITS